LQTQVVAVALVAQMLQTEPLVVLASLLFATLSKENYMTHFAKVQDGLVTQVIVAEAEFFETFVDTSPGEWIQTSYNTRGGVHYNPETGEPSDDQSKSLRKNYAGIGYTYDKELDAFIPPKLHASWILDEGTCLWNAPTAYPDDGKEYKWNEDILNWEELPE
jgi:hypothetical protein